MEERQNLTRKRNDMSAARLHLSGGHGPGRFVEVKLAPLGVAQFTGTHEYMRGNLEREPDDGAALEVVDGAQQFA